VYAQHDLGTLLITCAALYGVAWLGGMRKGVLLVVAVGAVVAVLLVVFLVGYRSSRFSAWLDPFGEYYGNGWQLAHGLYAFSSGGFFGTGIGMGLQKYEYLPEAENDFVFAVIGEETGFVGCMVVIGLFVLFGVAGLRISYAARERSLAESLLAGGLVVAIEAQALLNIGGTTGVLPLSGRPLPFISAGGTSVLVSLVMVAILYTIARANDRYRVERAQETGRRVRQRNLTVIDGGTEDREGRP
jgi:cell division protein FtsW